VLELGGNSQESDSDAEANRKRNTKKLRKSLKKANSAIIKFKKERLSNSEADKIEDNSSINEGSEII
jgi:hypothetical protein